MKRLLTYGLATMLLCGLALTATPVWSKERAAKVIAKGTRIGVVNLLKPELTHYHAAKDSNNSFLKIRAVTWPVDEMLTDALKEPLEQQGLTLAPLVPTEALMRARESCFVNAALTNGLPKSCSAPLSEEAATGGVNYLIVMAPGLNDANHAGGNRIEGVTAMMRGWGFLTRERAGAKDKPAVFDEVELLLIDVGPQGAVLEARQWGGPYTSQWQTYTMPADPHQIPAQQLDQLRPIFSTMLVRQAKDLLSQVSVAP